MLQLRLTQRLRVLMLQSTRDLLDAVLEVATELQGGLLARESNPAGTISVAPDRQQRTARLALVGIFLT